MNEKLRFLGRGGTPGDTCPSLYETEHHFFTQGWRTDKPGIVEIPHLLLGFADHDTFIGSPLTDTGRGTFLVSGDPVTDPEVLAQMEIEPNEAAVKVPKRERTFYGAAS